MVSQLESWQLWGSDVGHVVLEPMLTHGGVCYSRKRLLGSRGNALMSSGFASSRHVALGA